MAAVLYTTAQELLTDINELEIVAQNSVTRTGISELLENGDSGILLSMIKTTFGLEDEDKDK